MKKHERYQYDAERHIIVDTETDEVVLGTPNTTPKEIAYLLNKAFYRGVEDASVPTR